MVLFEKCAINSNIYFALNSEKKSNNIQYSPQNAGVCIYLRGGRVPFAPFLMYLPFQLCIPYHTLIFVESFKYNPVI